MPIKAQFDTVTINNKDGAVVYIKFTLDDGTVVDTMSTRYTADNEAEIQATVEKKLLELQAKYETSGNIQERMTTLCTSAMENVAKKDTAPIVIKGVK
ncbi:MAG: hypothetical protein A4E65_02322 [Syntrophorhabdus sp. PtaU1.Bin153]|nr:MAG: hypothetical protein A4E65_02322 [Syntrophorhabdus sp. PtaU1.Bin153]